MSNIIDLKKGLNIPISGKAALETKKTIVPDVVAVSPLDFKGILPRLLVKEGDKVLAGSPVLADKQNIVLIGMPGSGKSTIGRQLADMTGRPFADCDAEIARAVGMPVPDYIERYGESAFRDVETRVLHELSRQSGTVIATGGGAVTRRVNMETLKRNGLIVLLDRPLDELPVTKDRPLSRGRAALERLWSEREPLYRQAADLVLPVTGTPADTAERLAELLHNEGVL